MVVEIRKVADEFRAWRQHELERRAKAAREALERNQAEAQDRRRNRLTTWGIAISAAAALIAAGGALAQVL